jgi:hypothetical protein
VMCAERHGVGVRFESAYQHYQRRQPQIEFVPYGKVNASYCTVNWAVPANWPSISSSTV